MAENNELHELLDDEELKKNAKIKVIGVGGGGGNAVNGMIHDKEDLVEYWVFNTDCQALSHSPCENKLVLGRTVTGGLGAGGIPATGKMAAEESYEDIKRIVDGSDLIFIAAGEGGGTGTGAAPIVAKAAKEVGCLVIGIVTRPFNFEGKTRRTHALEGINALKENVDALIVISNDKLMFNGGNKPVCDTFLDADQILGSSVRTVTDLILKHGVINLDFADVKATLLGKGLALIGIGHGKGPNKAIEAADNAINSPLLEASIRGAHSMIVNFTVGPDTTLNDTSDAVAYINQAAVGKDSDEEPNIIFGVLQDPNLHDEMTIAIIATDFNKDVDFNTVPLRNAKPSADAPAPIVEQNADNGFVDEAIKKSNEVKNASVLPSFLRNKMKEPTVTEPIKEEPVMKQNAVSLDDDEDEPIVLSRDDD